MLIDNGLFVDLSGMYKKQVNIADSIVGHVRRNPVMGDTLEGITGWLREKERISCTIADVASSLERLLLDGIIKERVTKEGTIFYMAWDKGNQD
ncbi:MAG: hypothetical protein V3U16_01225 [Candidatus Neomarinimicrobiota bacterium]